MERRTTIEVAQPADSRKYILLVARARVASFFFFGIGYSGSVVLRLQLGHANLHSERDPVLGAVLHRSWLRALFELVETFAGPTVPYLSRVQIILMSCRRPSLTASEDVPSVGGSQPAAAWISFAAKAI